ncbi:hypothetical protein LshimejAT787_0210430 [Lyophyllum shimeji]|uniref:Uncharacterized protein n=1 Tax=Lyophyllum shimeji TaxID=47721 RepID=A0A9P3PHD4_LYOSH|nr:hypothetical protein LshimejAT787_0210430 [Lyophyllum shimeji]
MFQGVSVSSPLPTGPESSRRIDIQIQMDQTPNYEDLHGHLPYSVPRITGRRPHGSIPTSSVYMKRCPSIVM